MKIGSSSFAYTALTNFTLPKTIQVIDHSAFEYCTKLLTFTIPQNSELKTIESGVFTGCVSFKEIQNSCKQYDIWNHALFDSEKTTLIVLPPASGIIFFSFPETVQKIAICSLEEVRSLQTVYIPYSVRTIERYAFRNCRNLRSINLPSNVTLVEANAFQGCNKLQCGLVIENQTNEFRNMLIQTEKLPKHCFSDCVNTCNQRSFDHHIIPFIFVLIML